MGLPLLVVLVVVIVALLSATIKQLDEWERGVVLRLGRFQGVRGPGLIFLIPFVERLIRMDMRTITMDVQPQDVITKDNVSMKVNAVLYFKIVDPEAAITNVEDFLFATTQISQTTLRSIMGQFLLDEILANRDKVNSVLQDIIDRATEPWGIKVSAVEVKHIDLPADMQRAMAKEAEAERVRRAKVISAEGELQRSQKLADASQVLASSPSALQLAYLQTLGEISSDKTNTIIFPIPLDMVRPFMSRFERGETSSDQKQQDATPPIS